MGESRTPSGLIVETRALVPRDNPPNTNPDPYPPPPDASVAPGTVGPNALEGFGDTHVMWNGALPPPPEAQAWAGWPVGWQTPNWWGALDDLVDIAWTCLDRNSSSLATMPPYLVGAADSLPRDWLVNPDPERYSAWPEFAKQLFWDYQGAGETIVVCTARYSNGFPARFHVVPPWMVDVELRPGGTRAYAIGAVNLPTADVLHVRYQSRTTDARGHGPLEAGRSRLVAARLLWRYATQFVSSGAIPTSIITHPERLSADQTDELKMRWLEARSSSMGLPAILSGGITFETVGASLAELGLTDLAQLTESRIAVLLGMPPFLVGLPSGGDSLTYSNLLSILDYHWRSTLRSMAGEVMSALSLWLTPRGTTLELNADEYVKPGPYERAQVWQIMTGIGAMTVDEVRERERLGSTAPSEAMTQGVLA